MTHIFIKIFWYSLQISEILFETILDVIWVCNLQGLYLFVHIWNDFSSAIILCWFVIVSINEFNSFVIFFSFQLCILYTHLWFKVQLLYTLFWYSDISISNQYMLDFLFCPYIGPCLEMIGQHKFIRKNFCTHYSLILGLDSTYRWALIYCLYITAHILLHPSHFQYKLS